MMPMKADDHLVAAVDGDIILVAMICDDVLEFGCYLTAKSFCSIFLPATFTTSFQLPEAKSILPYDHTYAPFIITTTSSTAARRRRRSLRY